MKLSTMIKELAAVQADMKAKGLDDVEVYLQSPVLSLDHMITAYPNIFIVPEEYSPDEGGWSVNIRNWPY